MPATKAYPNGALAPSDKKTPETRADRDTTKISGPSAAGEDRIPPATASTSTAALIPAASQTRAVGRRDVSVVVTGRPLTQQRMDGGQQLATIGDHRPALAHDWPGHRPPPGPGGEQQVVIPGRAGLPGHMLGEPLTGNRLLVPQAGDPAVREDRRVDRTA